jgi:hypothetical protein
MAYSFQSNAEDLCNGAKAQRLELSHKDHEDHDAESICQEAISKPTLETGR